MSQTRRKSRIPTFNSREEEARFWDTHDTADFEDEFERTEVRFARNLSQGITVRFTPETLETLRATAQRKGHRPHDPGAHVDPGTSRGDRPGNGRAIGLDVAGDLFDAKRPYPR